MLLQRSLPAFSYDAVAVGYGSTKHQGKVV